MFAGAASGSEAKIGRRTMSTVWLAQNKARRYFFAYVTVDAILKLAERKRMANFDRSLESLIAENVSDPRG